MPKLRIRAKSEFDWQSLEPAIIWLLGREEGLHLMAHGNLSHTYNGDLAKIEAVYDKVRHVMGRFPLEIEILADQ